MAHYAFVDADGNVVEVIVGRDEGELGIDWEQYYSEFRGLRCLRTSYNTLNGEHTKGGIPFRGNYASIGMRYDEELDQFVPVMPVVMPVVEGGDRVD